jgi:hypothetical protein
MIGDSAGIQVDNVRREQELMTAGVHRLGTPARGESGKYHGRGKARDKLL